MKESDLRPFGIDGKRLDRDDPIFYLKNAPFPEEAFKGCPVCGSAMIASSQPVCSNPECPAWQILNNRLVQYSGRTVFQINKGKRAVYIYPHASYFQDWNNVRIFFEGLFDDIVIAKLGSNIYSKYYFLLQ